MFSRFFGFLLLLCLLVSSAVAKPDHKAAYRTFTASMKTFTTERGFAVKYVDRSRGPAILLLHGVPTSSWMYRKVIPRLAAKGYRVIAPDLLGLGASERISYRELLTPKARARRMRALMASLGIRRWTQMFHDVGGAVTWEMLLQDPVAVKALVVLNTFAYKDGWTHGMNTAKRWGMEALVRVPGFYGMAIKGMVEDKKMLSKSDLCGYSLPMRDGGTFAYMDFMRSIPQVEDRLERYQEAIRLYPGRSMILWGQHDDFLSADTTVPQLQRDLRVADEDVYIFDDAKHLVAEEKPETIVSRVASFLAREN